MMREESALMAEMCLAYDRDALKFILTSQLTRRLHRSLEIQGHHQRFLVCCEAVGTVASTIGFQFRSQLRSHSTVHMTRVLPH
jgi:hypothetical protein